MLDARNVSDDPHSNFYAASEFADKVLNAYLIVGAMNHHGMQSLDGEPTVNKYNGLLNDPEGKKQHVCTVIRSFIEQHVINQVPEMNTTAPISNDLTCRFCKRKYVQAPVLRKHEEKKHGFKPTAIEMADEIQSGGSDKVYNYTHQVLILLLLRLNHNNAISLGDGERIIRLYKFFCLYFKVSNCPKYAIATLQLLVQVNCLLSPRLAYSLTWNRFVNNQGHVDTNFPMDLSVEHDNKAFKNDIHSFRGEITDKSIARVSKSVEPTNTILASYDKTTCVKTPSGKYLLKSTEEDILLLVDHLQHLKIYAQIPGRKHSAFPNMPHNLLGEIEPEKLKGWISTRLRKFSKKHFYQFGKTVSNTCS